MVGPPAKDEMEWREHAQRWRMMRKGKEEFGVHPFKFRASRLAPKIPDPRAAEDSALLFLHCTFGFLLRTQEMDAKIGEQRIHSSLCVM